MVGDSFLDPNSSMEIIGDPKKMFNEENIPDIGECQIYGKMVKAWVKGMKERASSLFQEVKVAFSKENHIQQNIQKELATLKEQQIYLREIDDNLVEIKGMDSYIVKSLKLITSGEVEQIDIWLKNVRWKNDSMSQQLSEEEQFLNSYRLLKKKALGDIPMIIEGIPISEYTQNLDISSIVECIGEKISLNLAINKV